MRVIRTTTPLMYNYSHCVMIRRGASAPVAVFHPQTSVNVDRQSRVQYAEVLRHFAAGRLTNREYESATDGLLESRDSSLWAIWKAVWVCYDDIFTHRLTGKRALTKDQKHVIARAIVFLHSDLTYEWPRVPLRRMLLGLLTLGVWPRLFPAPLSGGDDAVWPFFRRSDLEVEAAQPYLLIGNIERGYQ